MNALIPAWIIGGPFIGLLILAFSFKGASTMGGTGARIQPRDRNSVRDLSSPLPDSAPPGVPRSF
jgi:hypothetical protein